MSILYGYIHLKGQSIDRKTIDTMKNALLFSKPDKEFEFVTENIALGCLHKISTPESVFENYPMTDDSENIQFFAACRIDNRDELSALLQVEYSIRNTITDGELMFRAYLKWGEEVCNWLLGDWSFVAYHKIENKLVIARDHCGITAMYYTQVGDVLYFSSSPKGILALNEFTKKVNEVRIAEILTVTPGNGEDTCYENLFNLLPGHYLKIENAEVKKIKFWELTLQDDLILPNEQDYYDQFLELFTKAVRARLRTTKNVGISLSGGLDSTSIAAIAAIELAKQNKELYAFTSVPLYKNYDIPKHRNGDEGELAGLMAKKYPNIRHFLVNAEGYDPIECIKKGVEIMDEPMHAASNQYWMQAIADKAVEMGVGNMLTGQGGNATISWPPFQLKILHSKNLYSIKYLISNSYKILKENSNRKIQLKNEFISNKNFDNYGIFYQYNRFFCSSFKTLKKKQLKFIKLLYLNANNIYARNSHFFELNFYDSTLDIKLNSFCLKIPYKLYKINKFHKILIEKSLNEFIPNSIFKNKYKGLQAADLKPRLLNSSFLTNFYNNININDFTYINTRIANRDISYLFFKSKFSKNLI